MSWAPAQLDDHHFTDGDGDTRNVPQLDTMGRKTDSVRTSELFTNRAVLKMTAIVSLGGLLFGFDTGVISGALPYLKDDAVMAPYATTPATLAWAQELVVSSALVAAGVGSAAGGWFADAAGRRRALLAADVLFTFGSLCMAAAQSLAALVVGRAVVGLAIGVASVTAPVFIAECAPPRVRAALVTMNVLMITGGQFLSYVSNYGFSFVPGTWRWMLGMAAVPAVAQAFGLLGLPESPKWLAGRGHAAAAKRAADLLQLPMQPMQPAQRAQQGGYGDDPEAEDGVTGRLLGGFRDDGGGVMERDGGTWAALTSRTVLRELHVGVGLQVLQQLAGINTVMYFAPTLLQAAGIHNPRTALLASLIPAATNAAGTAVGLVTIERSGRRRLFLASLAAVVAVLCALGGAFRAAETHSPPVVANTAALNAIHTAGATSCAVSRQGTCIECLKVGCGFCSGAASQPGVCLTAPALQFGALDQQCSAIHLPPSVTGTSIGAAHGVLYLSGCPSPYTGLTLFLLVMYLAAFSPGVGPVPWAVNSEIYPLEVRGLATGIAAAANWAANALVAQVFLTSIHTLGGSGTFWAIGAMAGAGWVWAWAVLPETKGLGLDDIQRLFAGKGVGAGGAEVGLTRLGS